MSKTNIKKDLTTQSAGLMNPQNLFYLCSGTTALSVIFLIITVILRPISFKKVVAQPVSKDFKAFVVADLKQEVAHFIKTIKDETAKELPNKINMITPVVLAHFKHDDLKKFLSDLGDKKFDDTNALLLIDLMKNEFGSYARLELAATKVLELVNDEKDEPTGEITVNSEKIKTPFTMSKKVVVVGKVDSTYTTTAKEYLQKAESIDIDKECDAIAKKTNVIRTLKEMSNADDVRKDLCALGAKVLAVADKTKTAIETLMPSVYSEAFSGTLNALTSAMNLDQLTIDYMLTHDAWSGCKKNTDSLLGLLAGYASHELFHGESAKKQILAAKSTL